MRSRFVRPVQGLPAPAQAAYASDPDALFSDASFPEDPRALASELETGALSPGQTLSDHLPLVSPATAIGRILTFNVLTRCWRSGDRTNNGFGQTETDAAYEARLDRLAERIERLVSEPVNVVVLQEAPTAAPAKLARLVRPLRGPAWAITTQGTATRQFGTLIAVRRTELEVLGGPGRAEARRAAQPTPGPEPTGERAQRGRVHELWVRARGGEDAILVANVHLEFSATAVVELERLLQAPRVVIAGDFNRPFDHPFRQLDGLAHRYGARVCFPDRPVSFAFRPAAEPVPCAIDGFVTRGLGRDPASREETTVRFSS